MGKIIILIFSALVLFANENPLSKCNECHNNFKAPPYKKVYRHYLVKYSSKIRVKKAMIDFLTAPAYEKSALSRGMKQRYNPDEHLVFEKKIITKAVKALVKKEDIIQRLKLKP